ncbi:MAG TPA: isocitrate lyase/phosphoenolpyruvate mutase family protein [Actinomycetota bacterium]|nr:isocitrate lyase/phosphoenolpyruvate mutase family protein [Actinomycetota bacterium]
MELDERRSLLRSLHVRGNPLVLPNAWDAASALAVVEAGFAAVATSSSAVAESLGYEDGEGAPAAEMFAAAARIARVIDIPLTVDAEAGYGMAADEFVDALSAAGAAGCNFEDTDHATGSITDAATQTARLAAIRAAAGDGGLVLNARVDVFLRNRSTPQAELLDEGVERARAYLGAGADCVYPIFLSDDEVIGRFVESVGGPVNILAGTGAPDRDRLAELGVARISYGAGLHHRVMSHFADLLAAIPR